MLRRTMTAVTAAIAVGIVSSPAIATPGAIWAEDRPRDKFVGDEALRDVRDPLANHRMRADRSNALRGSFENCPHDYDVLHYDLSFNELNESAGGPRRRGGDRLRLAHRQPDVHRSRSDVPADRGQRAPGLHDAALVQPRPPTCSTCSSRRRPTPGDTVSVDVAYSGLPANEGGVAGSADSGSTSSRRTPSRWEWA